MNNHQWNVGDRVWVAKPAQAGGAFVPNSHNCWGTVIAVETTKPNRRIYYIRLDPPGWGQWWYHVSDLEDIFLKCCEEALNDEIQTTTI